MNPENEAKGKWTWKGKRTGKREKIAKQPHPRTLAFLSISRLIVLFVAGMLLFYHAIVIAAAIQAWQGGFLHEFSLLEMIAKNALLVSGYVFAAYHLKSWTGNLAMMVVYYFSGEYPWDFLRRPSSFTLATTFWGFLLVLGVAALLLLVLRFFVVIAVKARRHYRFFDDFTRIVKKSRYAWILVLVAVGATSGLYVLSRTPLPGETITITPQAYQIRFRFWASAHVSWYLNYPHGTDILEQFDRHGVTIQSTLYPLGDESGNLESFDPTVNQTQVDNLVSNLTWFWNNYPGIKFQYYAFGVGYSSNGNYEGSIYTPAMLKRFVDVCRNHSLPNVVGIYTDWEGPASPMNHESNNVSRNGWHQALWTDAMAYARRYFPNWTFSNCYPDEMMFDGYDGDADKQYYNRYNIFMPTWDDYGPMTYRSCNPDPYSPGNYQGPWMVYAQAKAQLEGALHGNVSKASMWLGCTGCGPYNNQTGGGLDALAKDILILKHFGYPTVSIFHAIKNFDNKPFTTGFFDQYGYTDALDKLNETVNGPGSTASFTIQKDSWMPERAIINDLLLNFNRLEYLPAMGVCLLAGVLATLTTRGFARAILDQLREITRHLAGSRQETASK